MGFQPPESTNHLFKNDFPWTIDSSEDLDRALEALTSPNDSPSSVVITQTPDMIQSKFNDFVYLIIKWKCELSVFTAQFRDAGQPAVADNKEFTTLLCEEFTNKTSKCTIREYRGPLSMEALSLFHETVQILGLPLSTRHEAIVLATVLQDISKFRSLQALYVSVGPSITTSDVEFFQGLCMIRFGLMFANLHDCQVSWMMDIVTALDKPLQIEHVCVDEIYLPASKLTIVGMRQLLKLFQRSDGAPALKYPIFVESTEIQKAVENHLQTSFEEYGGSVVFSTTPPEFKTNLFGRKQMSKTHGFYNTTSYTLSILRSIVDFVWSFFNFATQLLINIITVATQLLININTVVDK